MTATEKQRFPRAEAILVAKEVAAFLKPGCHRIIVAGSIRRGKPDVGDVEIVYIPKIEWCRDPGDFFAIGEANMADKGIAEMELRGILTKRTNINGSTMFGAKNKLMEHCGTGIPVDLFATEESYFFNYLVCRTGPSEQNIKIASIAKRMGYMWNPYRAGFYKHGDEYPVTSEAEVFSFVRMPMPKRFEVEI